MYRSRRGRVMLYEYGVLFAIFSLQVIILWWQLQQKKDVLIADFEEILAGAVDDLDGRLAQALGSIAENLGVADFERPNPFQQLLAQFLQQKLNQNEIENIARSENGQFKSLKDEILDSD